MCVCMDWIVLPFLPELITPDFSLMNFQSLYSVNLFYFLSRYAYSLCKNLPYIVTQAGSGGRDDIKTYANLMGGRPINACYKYFCMSFS
jgi:hypothetical protein